MGRVFFPTSRSNILGVRDTTPNPRLAGLGALNELGFDWVIPRAPAEPYPRAVNNPTGPMLGALGLVPVEAARTDVVYYNRPLPIVSRPTPILTPAPIVANQPISVVTPTPGSPASVPAATAPPVMAQSSPTPVVSIPQQAAPSTVLVTSGGGTAAPATVPTTGTVYTTDQYGNIVNAATGQVVMSASAAAAYGQSAASLTAAANPGTSSTVVGSASLTDQVAQWLSGTTALFGYNVPNAGLAAVVVLGAALLMGGKKK